MNTTIHHESLQKTRKEYFMVETAGTSQCKILRPSVSKQGVPDFAENGGYLFTMSDKYIFDVGHARKYGVDEAIVIQNFIFWISKNAANKIHYHEGRYWTYNSNKAFTALFPFWTHKQIRRILKSLTDKGVIMTGEFNKVGYDRTLWYSFTDKFIQENQELHLQPAETEPSAQMGKWSCPNGQMDVPEWENGVDQTGKPIPYINTYVNAYVEGSEPDSQESETLSPLNTNNAESVPTISDSVAGNVAKEIVNTKPRRTPSISIKGKEEGKELLTPQVAATPLTLQEREAKFRDELRGYADKYTPDTLNAFFLYWSEPTKDGKKMLWESKKTWCLKKRLQTWVMKDTQWGHTTHTAPRKRPDTGATKTTIGVQNMTYSQLKNVYGE